jgi:hypothetical protein
MSDDIGEARRLSEEQVLDDHEEVLLRQDAPNAGEVGQRDDRVGRRDPQQLDRALFGVAEDLHRVGRFGPVGDRDRVDVHSSASCRMCSGLFQLRRPGRSPSGPVSRVFRAVGWPFIW